jgi:malate synthase
LAASGFQATIAPLIHRHSRHRHSRRLLRRSQQMHHAIDITGPITADGARVLTPEALRFAGELEARFGGTRIQLLDERRKRDAQIAAGASYGLLAETEAIRRGDWKVAAAPADLQRRHVEITGPAERKMIINALGCGADVFMADFEDSLSPTWDNVVSGQAGLIDAVRRTLTYTSPEGKAYALAERLATLVVRPRGWHLTEKHAAFEGRPVSASLFDFGLYFFHNARALVERGSGPYFYLPKIESHREARLWNDVFVAAQEALGLPRGTVRATVLIETLPAAFEMDEILHELRDHASGLNAGRWDYLFSAIKKLRDRPGLAIPDRTQLAMTVPFMRAYTERLVRTCHHRGAHAMGGMAPFIPSRKNPEINAAALAKVRDDKLREVGDGFDGTWVAHPDLVTTAAEVFGAALGARPHQKDRLRDDVRGTDAELLDLTVPGGEITEAGVRNNISVALQYLSAWLAGSGAVAIFNLMEDAATAEISRAQLWFWVHHRGALDDGRPVTAALYRALRDDEAAKLAGLPADGQLPAAKALLDRLVESDDFLDFLTSPAYEQLGN